jgi:hypothetical protein
MIAYAHDDQNYNLCATYIHMRVGYTQYDDPVVAYFAFPCKGTAISLCPGDLLFLIQESHIASHLAVEMQIKFIVYLFI